MTTQAIGFADKYYTLWSIDEECYQESNGRVVKTTRFRYDKNISFDKDTAITKYPNAVFMEELRGKTRSWNYTKTEWSNVDTFRFGKYYGSKIADCTDNSYLEWYFDAADKDGHQDYVGEVLMSRGYEIRRWGERGKKYLMSPEALEDERREKKEMEERITMLKTNEPFEVFIDRNPSYEGFHEDGNTTYHFQEVKECYYQDWEYYLPILNGKAKRVKNKNILIKKYTFSTTPNKINIEILDFEVLKQ